MPFSFPLIRHIALYASAALLVALTLSLWLWVPHPSFPVGKSFHVKEGMTLGEVARGLADKNFVKSASLFTLAARLVGGQTSIKAGDYLFEVALGDGTVLWRLLAGYYSKDVVRLTIPEGANVREVAFLAARKLTDFDREAFIELAESAEGYLFPDTYFVSPATSPENLLHAMRENFDRRVRELGVAIAKSGRSIEEIVTMASIIEEEAPVGPDRRLIAGILWKRADDGQRLQVDAVFPYIIGKNTYQLSRKDLQYDSPYNTYLYEGLPPGPITNPGLDAILAAAEPVASPYWFYLSNRSGKMYYAVTYAEHTKNKRLYLNQRT